MKIKKLSLVLGMSVVLLLGGTKSEATLTRTETLYTDKYRVIETKTEKMMTNLDPTNMKVSTILNNMKLNANEKVQKKAYKRRKKCNRRYYFRNRGHC